MNSNYMGFPGRQQIDLEEVLKENRKGKKPIYLDNVLLHREGDVNDYVARIQILGEQMIYGKLGKNNGRPKVNLFRTKPKNALDAGIDRFFEIPPDTSEILVEGYVNWGNIGIVLKRIDDTEIYRTTVPGPKSTRKDYLHGF